jgi:membrane protease YdiL (CAAX protease family)
MAAPIIALTPLIGYRLLEQAVPSIIGATYSEVITHLVPPLGMLAAALLPWRLVPPLPQPAPRRRRGHLGRSIAVGMALGTLAALVNLLLMLAGTDEDGSSGVAVAHLATAATVTPGTGALVVHVVLLAPVAEELAFRGLIYRIFRRTMLPLAATVLSAVIFGLMHVDPGKAVWAFFLGLIVAVAYEQTRSILAPILIHALFNAVPVGVAVLRAKPDDSGPIWFVLAVAALIFTFSARSADRARPAGRR